MAQDGVLIRGDNALPAAKRALAFLDGNNHLGMYVFPLHRPLCALTVFRSKIPYLLVNDTSCFPLPIKLNHSFQLTNGGGVSESARCHKLSQQLGITVRSAV